MFEVLPAAVILELITVPVLEITSYARNVSRFLHQVTLFASKLVRVDNCPDPGASTTYTVRDSPDPDASDTIPQCPCINPAVIESCEISMVPFVHNDLKFTH